MDQSELRNWEARCTQEEPPKCRAACPLHVDAREFCIRMADGKPDQAWATLCRTLPLPSVMARICDAPCKKACLRKEVGGALEMGALERACADAATKTPPMHTPPSRGRKATIIGGDIAALTAAWDLARKGVEITLHCPCSASDVLNWLRYTTPINYEATVRRHLETEISNLHKMGVLFHENAVISLSLVNAARADEQPVFIAPDTYAALLDGTAPPDVVTLGTAQLGVFAALRPAEPEQAFSPVFLAALGRRAALSIDRLFQGATLVAGREREGIFETRLFTNISKTPSMPPVPMPREGYNEDQATAEAARCLRCECMECVKNCAYLAEYGSYPKQYTRRIYNNESIVMGTRQANTMINSCMMCGLCESLCPEGFDMGALCLQSRQGMVTRGKMPQSAHEFALRDMAFANSPVCTLARHEPDTERSAWLFFPGCQLTASLPDAAERAWHWLRDHLRNHPASDNRGGGVGLMLHCCGAPAQWAGQTDLYAGAIADLCSLWERLGKPTLITACPTCTDMLRTAMPQATITTVWEVFDHAADHAATYFPPAPLAAGTELVLHDPCNTRHDAPLRTAVRNLLQQRSIAVTEPELTGEHTECCGFGGLSESANPSLGAKIRSGRAARLAAASSADTVTYCAMCRDMLATSGTRILHMLDLLLPPDTSRNVDMECCGAHRADHTPYTGPAPTYSERRENRIRLRERLSTQLWNEANTPPAPHSSVRVAYTAEASSAMQKRRILDSDVRKVLRHMEQHNAWLENVTDSGSKGRRLAVFRPTIVTYWVELTLQDDGSYLVHNTWSHRMRIIPPRKGESA